VRVLLFMWGLPILPLLGGLIAIAGVWGLSRAMGMSAWTTAERLLAPPGALGRALLPLLLAITVICAFAFQLLAWPIQLVAGALLAGLCWLFIRGGGEFEHERVNSLDLKNALDPRTPFPWQALAAPACIAIASGILFLSVSFGNPFGTWTSSAGPSGLVESLALTLVFVAGSLRVFGYATSWWRAIAATALGAFVIRGLSWAGVFPGEHTWGRAGATTGRAALLVVLVLVACFAIETWKLRNRAPIVPGQAQKLGRASGFWAAVVSAGLLALALIAAAVETTAGAGALGRDDYGALEPTAAPKIVTARGGQDRALALTFAPVLHFHHDEEYPPISVDTFLSGSTEAGARPVTSPTGDPLPLSLRTLPTVCPDGEHDACGKISCPACVDRRKENQPEGFTPQGVFYTRVARREGQPGVFKGWNPWGEKLRTLIQYWIFYGYDRWETETVVGRLVQEHQGDWEAVSVGLDDRDAPLFVALSAHCGGQVVPWSKITAAPGEVVDGKLTVTPARTAPDADVAHPVVAVARGSHANYAVSGGHRPPDWGSCKHLPSRALSALSYASNVRDVTDDSGSGWFAYPLDVRLVNRGSKPIRPMSYPGAWGDGETITFGHRAPTRTGRGPLSPPLQGASWRTPVQLYFCGSHWYGEDAGGMRLHGTTEECKQGSGA